MRGKSMAATTVAMQRGNCAATTAMRHSSCMATSVARARQPAWQPAWCRAVAAQVAMQLPGRAATVARQWPRCTAVVVAIGTAIARHEHGKRRAQHGKSMTIMDHGCLFARSPGVEARRRGATDYFFRGLLLLQICRPSSSPPGVEARGERGCTAPNDRATAPPPPPVSLAVGTAGGRCSRASRRGGGTSSGTGGRSLLPKAAASK